MVESVDAVCACNVLQNVIVSLGYDDTTLQQGCCPTSPVLDGNRFRNDSTKRRVLPWSDRSYAMNASRRIMLKSLLIPKLVRTREVNDARA